MMVSSYSVVSKSVAVILEDPEAVKNAPTKSAMFKTLAVCARNYDSNLTQGTILAIRKPELN
jgi:hypothetical protein